MSRPYLYATGYAGTADLAVSGGYRGLRDGTIREMDWMDVSSLVKAGGAELGTNRWVLAEADPPQITELCAAQRIDGLLPARGERGTPRRTFCRPPVPLPGAGVPIDCFATTINELPATELTVTSDRR
jgi:6-phosphofructokinase 1